MVRRQLVIPSLPFPPHEDGPVQGSCKDPRVAFRSHLDIFQALSLRDTKSYGEGKGPCVPLVCALDDDPTPVLGAGRCSAAPLRELRRKTVDTQRHLRSLCVMCHIDLQPEDLYSAS